MSLYTGQGCMHLTHLRPHNGESLVHKDAFFKRIINYKSNQLLGLFSSMVNGLAGAIYMMVIYLFTCGGLSWLTK